MQLGNTIYLSDMANEVMLLFLKFHMNFDKEDNFYMEILIFVRLMCKNLKNFIVDKLLFKSLFIKNNFFLSVDWRTLEE